MEAVFPAAIAAGTTLVAFNNTCYGRLLKPSPHSETTPLCAADCYRYTLSREGVSVCLTAPSTLEQLEENLAVRDAPPLTDEETGTILAHGDAVYREETVFRRLIRAL